MSEDRRQFQAESAPTHTWEQAVEWLRSQPQLSEFVRDCYFDDPILESTERFVASSEWKAIQRITKPRPGLKVLELGAGRGLLSYAFAKQGCMVTAIEPDPSSLVGSAAIAELARLGGVAINIQGGYAEDLPIPSGSMDLVVCRAALHHARDVRQACRETARVLRSGGRFVALREHVISRPEDLPEFLASHPLHFLYGGEHAYLLGDYQDAIKAAGLKLRHSYGPFDDAVNYLPPVTKETFHELPYQALAKRINPSVARVLSKLSLVQRAYAASLTWRSDAPGRFYSFVAQKP